jgi:hypothetical protein
VQGLLFVLGTTAPGRFGLISIAFTEFIEKINNTINNIDIIFIKLFFL